MTGAGKMLLLAVALCALAMPLVHADLYMHSFDGSNNRLNEQNRDRQNGNRLFDSQNNDRGGRNVGTYARMYYYTTSTLRIEWTNQHSCGNPNNNCEIIMQYYCDANVTRDGTTTNTIPDVGNEQAMCYNADCDDDTMYGRHESQLSYQQCKWRQRNMGLWTSTQDMSYRYGAIFTRQNNNGNRFGYECPEERDYYPYWAPTVWRDIAIVTNDTQRCAAYQAASENVVSRFYCKVSDAFIASKVGTNLNQPLAYGFVPITQAACEDALVGGVWTESPAHKVAAPACVQAPWTRDNHLGNAPSDGKQSETAYWDWQVPEDLVGDACVFRMRYNITTSETRNAGEWFTDDSVAAGNLNASDNYFYLPPPNGISINQDDDNVETNNPRFYKWADQVNVWSKFGLTRQENVASFDPTAYYNDLFMTANPSRGYVFRNDPVVDIFGSLLTPQTAPFTNSPLPGAMLPLRLSLDTSQYGRTFQDRSHTFSIRSRSTNPGLAASTTPIYNVGVRGKRGNIVQVYPSVEYDFVPNTLSVNQGDWIHFQWTGSNTNPQNDGQPAAQTDRSNIVVLRAYGNAWNANPAVSNLHGPFSGSVDGVATNFTTNWKLSYPSRIDATGMDFMGMTFAQKKMLAKNGIYSAYFDMPPVQALTTGIFNYMCTRNNAFTNRGQKAQIQVNAVANAAELVVTAPTATSRLISASGASWIRYAPDPLGQTTNTQLNIQELGNGRLLITPLIFDVVAGQKVMLDMTYTSRPLTNVYVYQSNLVTYNGDEMNAIAANGVATVAITQGGYYHVEQPVSGSAMAGVVIGVAAAIGLIGFGYYKLKTKFHIRDKKHIALAQDAHSP